MKSKQILKSLHSLLDWKQKITFLFIMLIMVLSSVLTQLTPKAIGWLTDDILSQAELDFPAIFPILFFILIVNIVNEIIKILRRILVEDIATKRNPRRTSGIKSTYERSYCRTAQWYRGDPDHRQ